MSEIISVANVDETDLRYLIGENLAKASALASNTFGGSGESFRNMSDTLQDNYMWTVSDLIEQAEKAWIELENRRYLAFTAAKAKAGQGNNP